MMGSLSRLGLQAVLTQVASNASSNASLPGSEQASGSSLGSGNPPFSSGPMDSILLTTSHAFPIAQIVLFIYKLIDSRLGLDPSLMLTILGLCWGASKVGNELWEYLMFFADRYLMCAMYIEQDDDIYDHLMNWLSQQPSIMKNQYLMAQTVWKSAWEEEDDLEDALFWTDGGEGGSGDKKYLNFSNQAARSTPRFVPAMGATSFWHKGVYFRFTRRKESLMNTKSAMGAAVKDVEELKVSCFGRSINPIKQLLAEAKILYYHDTDRKTTIYRPRMKEVRREWNMWQQVARRPVRPMSTVVLDPKEKHDILQDVNDYLHPSTPRWYASRGIPLRRGYLFHGPPGTGKTSFSFALAGVFGIDIYVISLQDVNISEEDLASLFTRLPRRCIVLLEDIDSAGLKREGDLDVDASGDKEEGKKGSKDSKKKKRNEGDVSGSDSDSDSDAEEAKKLLKKMRNMKKRKGKGRIASPESISLSGLLNAIDGVASHEGRILIMTTNKPESLDEALIRPGRVDVQVKFGNASKSQASELFLRMYETARGKGPLNLGGQVARGQADGVKDELNGISPEEMAQISNQFGEKIPAEELSPAQIQGFLLKRKKVPRQALAEVDDWVEASLAQKESNSKVATVQ